MRATEKLALSVLEQQGEVDDLPGAQDTEPIILYPGTDYKNGTLYMTFPRFREIEIRNKKGDVTGTELKVSTFALTSEGTAFWYDPETVTRKGYVFPHTFTQQQESRWPIPDIDAFRTGQAETIMPLDLYTDLRETVIDHVEYERLDSPFYDLVVYYILLTYVFRIFPSIAYLHFNGTMASGKSQNLRLFSLLGFNAIWASNMSPASLYRQVAGCPGVLCIDEAESFEGERGEELRRLLNAGYTAPGLVPRAEKVDGDRFSTVMYATYGPKVLASINPMEPVIGSRCIVIPMQPSLRDIKPIRINDEKWPLLRNKLYLWAMQNAYEIEEKRDYWANLAYAEDSNLGLKDRQWELALPFVVMADHIGGRDEAMKLIDFFKEQFIAYQKAQEETDRLRLLLKCLPAVLIHPDGPIDGDWYYLKTVHDVVAEHLDEDAREYYRTKATSKHLKALGWRERRSHKGGNLVRIPEESVREQFRKRNIDPFTPEEVNFTRDDVKWLAGELTYADNRTPAPTPEPEPTLWTGAEPDDDDQ